MQNYTCQIEKSIAKIIQCLHAQIKGHTADATQQENILIHCFYVYTRRDVTVDHRMMIKIGFLIYIFRFAPPLCVP